MSTMEPDEMFGGRRIEGNSIWICISMLILFEQLKGTYQSFVLGQQDGDACIDLADC